MSPLTALKFLFLFSAAPLGLLVRRSLHRPVVEVFVDLFIGVMGKRREALRENLERAFGDERSPAEIHRMVREVFANYALYLGDYMTFPIRDRRSVLGLLGGIRGAEHMLAARAKGNGVILVGPHVGNWEIGGYLLRDLDCPVHALSVHDPHPSLDRFRGWFREREGVSVIFVGPKANAGGMFEIQAALEKNEAVAMLGDRLYMGRECEANFFGRTVRLPAGPLHIAALTAAPIVPFAAVREGERYVMVLLEPIEVRDPSDETVSAAGQRLAAGFEFLVRSWPDQWFNFERVF
jgi:KDO2-lipid IV(A) lauroyltransferase